MSYEDKDVLIPLRDANVINIKTNEYFREGCETCDYGQNIFKKLHLILMMTVILNYVLRKCIRIR